MPHRCLKCEQEIEQPSSDPISGAEICPLCGTPLIPSTADNILPPGFTIAGFRIERTLGRGGMGTVYLSNQLNLERHVALKVLSASLARDESFVERFFREARAAACLSHPNIVQAYDAGATPEGLYFFAMENAEGETLEKRITKEGRLNCAEAVDIALKIAEALNYAWTSQSLCHGDIKPENIIQNPATKLVKLSDLGLAKSLHDSSADHDRYGTPLYAPPEIIRGENEKKGALSDMYSFGATIYCMLAGRPPFPGDDPDAVLDRHLYEVATPIWQLLPDTPPRLSSLIDKLISKDQAGRPATWQAVVDELRAISEDLRKAAMTPEERMAETAIPLPFEAPPKPAPSPERTKALILKSIIATMLLAIAALSIVVIYLATQTISERNAVKATAMKQEKQEEAEWLAFKASLDAMPPVEAVNSLQAHIDKRKKLAFKQAASYMGVLQNRLAEPLRQKLKELSMLSSDSKQLLAKPALELQRVIDNVDSAIELAESSSLLTSFLPQEQKAAMLQTKSSIEAELNRRSAEEKAKIEAEKRRQEQERAEAERKRKLEEQRKAAERKALAERNTAIDRFVSIVASQLPLKRQEEEKASLLKDLNAVSQSLPEPFLTLGKSLSDALKKPSPSPDVFIASSESCLKGQQLPSSPQLIIDSCDQKNMKLYQLEAEGKAKIGRKIAWQQFSQEDLALLLKERILTKRGAIAALPEELQERLLADTLLYGNADAFTQILEESNLAQKTKAKWQELASFAKSAKSEAEAVKLWQDSCAKLEQGAAREALTGFDKLESSYSGSKFVERWSAAIKEATVKARNLQPQPRRQPKRPASSSN